MPTWLRKIWTPSYGNYGGASNKCDKTTCPKPIDALDSAFMFHDNQLSFAETKEEIRKADYILYKHAKEINSFELNRPIFGRLYKASVIGIFGLASGALEIKPLKWGAMLVKKIKF